MGHLGSHLGSHVGSHLSSVAAAVVNEARGAGGGGGFGRVLTWEDVRKLEVSEKPPRKLAPRRTVSAGIVGTAGVTGHLEARAVSIAGVIGGGQVAGELVAGSVALASVHASAVVTGMVTATEAIPLRSIERLIQERVDRAIRAETTRVDAERTAAVDRDRTARCDAQTRADAERADRSRAALHALAGRRMGLATRRRRIPRQQYPKLIESDYATAIVGIFNRARPALAPLMRELPSLLTVAQAERGDRRDVGEASTARTLIDQAKAHIERAIQPGELEHLAAAYARRTAGYQRDQLGRQLKAALGIDVPTLDSRLPALIEHFAQHNAALIKSVPVDVVAKIEKMVMGAFTSGTPHAQLAEEISNRFDIGERHARLIARDQVGKIYGQVNAFRQKDLGVTSFVWQTMHDERVRDDHVDLDGKVFAYNDPPDEGLPGEPTNCRCYAEPVFDDILADMDE